MNKNTVLFFAILLLTACTNTTEKQYVQKKYFDLKGYFQQEANRLNKTKPLVDKTVTVNDSSERRKIKIEDWSKELSNFIDSDINKSAWQGLFRVVKNDKTELYSSNEDKVLVKILKISRKNHEISGIEILQETSNYLYTSVDTLTYYPDSLYEIRKTQHIKFLNAKKYKIRGEF